MSRINSLSILTLNKIKLPKDIINKIISFWCRDLLNYKTLFRNSSKTSILFESIDSLDIKYDNIYELNNIIQININETIIFTFKENDNLISCKQLINKFQICSICGNYINCVYNNKYINCSCWDIYDYDNDDDDGDESDYRNYYRSLDYYRSLEDDDDNSYYRSLDYY